MNQIQEIQHFAVGGTIDSHWDPARDTAVPNTQSILPEYVDAVRLPRHRFRSETLLLRDSREIGVKDQDLVAARVAESPCKNILISSGTYLMPDIARCVLSHPAAVHFKRLGKRIAFFGAITPLRGFLLSDGGFNLGMAVAALQEDINARVILIMNGMCFDVEQGIRKDLTAATFGTHGGHDILTYDQFTLVPTGGSIDFVPDGMDGFSPSQASLVSTYLREHVRLQRPFHAINPFVKDSRELNDEDKSVVLDTIRMATTEHVLITLGIYKMKQLREFLQRYLSRSDLEKKILLTGSRLPLLSGDMTDAPFNLGYALGKMGLGSIEKGINVALNGVLVGEEDDPVELIYTESEKQYLKELGVGTA